MQKAIVSIAATALLSGCGLGTGPKSFLYSTPKFVDVSSTGSTATIEGATSNVLLVRVMCRVEEPAEARVLRIDAGPTEIAVGCTVVGEYTETASFKFNAIADHEYRIRMHVPGNGNIDLIDDTDRKIIDVHGSSF
jgi:hypothetical protein